MAANKKITLPIALIAPYIREYLEKSDMGEVELTGGWGKGGTSRQKYSAVRVLASEANMDENKIYIILRGYTTKNGKRHTNIAIETADRLLCAMGKPELWYTDANLNRYYTASLS